MFSYPNPELNKNNNFVKTVILFLSLIIRVIDISAQTDSTYIGSFEQDLFIKTSVYRKSTTLTHEIDEETEIRYKPNSPVGVGIGLSFKNFSFTAGTKFNFMRDKNRGKTNSVDLQYHYYGKKFIADVFFQNYKGFYVEDETQENIFYLYPDLKLLQYGLHGEYIFNHKKYSYRAAFHQKEKQLRSTGSFQLGGGLYYNRISGEEAFMADGKKRYSNYQFNISGGYAYTLVIKRDFFASLTVSVGAAFGNQRINNFFKDIEISPCVFPRFSMGYNGNSWSIGVNAIVSSIYVSHSNNQNLLFDTGRMNLQFIKRFDIRSKKAGNYLYSLPYFRNKAK